MLDPARPIGATALRKTLLDFRLYLPFSVSVGTWRAPTPLVVATARDLQDSTSTTDRKLRVLLLYPGVLHGSCCAKYAAAFFKMSRSSFKRVFSLRRRFSSS
jgi:hypothetical protein